MFGKKDSDDLKFVLSVASTMLESLVEGDLFSTCSSTLSSKRFTYSSSSGVACPSTGVKCVFKIL